MTRRWAPGLSEKEKQIAVHVFMCSGIWPTGTTVDDENSGEEE